MFTRQRETMPGNIISITPEEVASWPRPNYVDPVERTWLPVYAGVLYGFATLLLGVRLILRSLKRAGVLGIDDVRPDSLRLGPAEF